MRLDELGSKSVTFVKRCRPLVLVLFADEGLKGVERTVADRHGTRQKHAVHEIRCVLPSPERLRVRAYVLLVLD